MNGNSSDGADKLSPQDKAKLARILSRLSSDFENERDNAARLAAAFVHKHNLDWSDLPEMLSASSVHPSSQSDNQSYQDRRRRGVSGWRGYDRRRPNGSGVSLDISA